MFIFEARLLCESNLHYQPNHGRVNNRARIDQRFWQESTSDLGARARLCIMTMSFTDIVNVSWWLKHVFFPKMLEEADQCSEGVGAFLSIITQDREENSVV